VLLLVHDDPDTVSALIRLLARDGREINVAVSVDQAVAALQAKVPSVLLLAPGIEFGRGRAVLDELFVHTQGRGAPVLFLGEGISGFDCPVAEPPFAEGLVDQVRALAPPPSDALLARAEQLLENARARATASREAQDQAVANLSQQLATAREELECLRESSRQSAETKALELGALVEKLQAERALKKSLEKRLAHVGIDFTSALERLKVAEVSRAKLEASLETSRAEVVTLQRQHQTRLKEPKTQVQADQAADHEQRSQARGAPVASPEGQRTGSSRVERLRSLLQGASALDVNEALDVMYEQLEENDYFGILGLPRSAGIDDLRRARERLVKLFDPQRWSTHPARLRRARIVLAQIEEAARVLGDDRLRGEYSRHLEE
jgi:hypothetical protein